MNLFKRIARKALSPYLYNLTSSEIALGRYHYSQFGEDILVEDQFKNKSVGKYLDIGASNPIYLSNTYALYKKGWCGTAIDPNPDSARMFAAIRPRDFFLQCAISEETGSSTFVFFDESTFSTLRNHAVDVPIEFQKGRREKQVQTLSFSDLIENHKLGSIDFLNIDCEGSDESILMSIPFGKFQPTIICIEDHCRDWLSSNITKFLHAQSYEIVGRCGPSSLFKYVQIEQ